jgi:NADPH-dependent glutamate synthase beta subunit-like oxidoreductase
MIRYGIPEYRLPKKVLEWEIDGILKTGIVAKTNFKLGVDFTIGSLISSGFDAVFLGICAWKDYTLRVEGENLEGCYTGINFLTRFAKWQQGDSDDEMPIGNQCVVIGGGNTAIDCVRTLIRLGAQEVNLVYRRTRAEMPANEVEIVAAEHEGVKFTFLAAPTKVVGDENGHCKQLEYLKMELGEPDASGRRRPVPIEGSETLLDCDMLITAIGQGPEISFKENDTERIKNLGITRWNTIDQVNPITLQTNIPYIFTAGDSATGASLVVEAIGGGRRAARSIHQYLSGEEVKAPEKALFKKHIKESIFESVPGIEPEKRAEMPELPVQERITCFDETDLVLEEKEALRESMRCLQCCRLCYNKDDKAA